MQVNEIASGQRQNLKKRMKKLVAAIAVSTFFAVGGLASVVAGGETRTISLTHIHTGESLTITYKKDGQYIPSAMRQINYLLRDWRKNQVVSIDPRTIDLVWELHEDLGSHEPIRVVCGYRSASTNAFLKRIGRKVAKESQHIRGNAIDFYFPDVSTQKIRNIALVRQLGGVGFYRSAGGPTGFLHVDSGHVRHWGPAISGSQMAQIFRDSQKIVGRRLRNIAGETAVAAADEVRSPVGFISKLLGLDKSKPQAMPAVSTSQVASVVVPVPVPPKPTAVDVAAGSAYTSSAADMADLSADAATMPKPKTPANPKLNQSQMASLGDLTLDASASAKAPKSKPAQQVAIADVQDEIAVDAATAIVRKDRIIPKPRLKPVEVMLLAAANMKTAPQLIRINAASAPPPDQSGRSVAVTGQGLGVMMEAAAVDITAGKSASVKGSLGAELRSGTAKGLPIIKPMIVSSASSDIDWWPKLALRSQEEAIRRDGQPVLIGTIDQDVLPQSAILTPRAGSGAAYAATMPDEQHTAEGKGDLLSVVVN